MAFYEVRRSIIHNACAYNVGDRIDLSDAEAAQMTAGQLAPWRDTVPSPPPAPERVAPVEPQAAPAVDSAASAERLLEDAVESEKQAEKAVDRAEAALAAAKAK